MTVRLFYFPRYSNPYQDLLYRRLAGPFEIRAAGMRAALAWLRRRPGARAVFHLHWEDAIYKDVRPAAGMRAAIAAFLALAREFRGLGGRLAWTIHNLGTHEPVYREHDRWLRAELSRLAHAAFVHTLTGRELLQRELPALAGRVHVAPHGNYAGVYPFRARRDAARRAFGYAPADTVFLAFGMLRPYKRLDWVLQAAAAGAAQAPGLKLLVAGPVLPQDRGRLRLQPRGAHAALVLRRVPDVEVQRYFAAADYAVFAAGGALTSGSMILALGFGTPVIAFGAGDAAELLLDARAGFLVAEDSPVALADAMLRAAALPAPERAAMSAAAARIAQGLSWDQSARVHRRVFETLFA